MSRLVILHSLLGNQQRKNSKGCPNNARLTVGWLRQQASDEIHQARVICDNDNSQGSPHSESLLYHTAHSESLL